MKEFTDVEIDQRIEGVDEACDMVSKLIDLGYDNLFGEEILKAASVLASDGEGKDQVNLHAFGELLIYWPNIEDFC